MPENRIEQLICSAVVLIYAGLCPALASAQAQTSAEEPPPAVTPAEETQAEEMQADDLSSERPTFSANSTTVPALRFQLEAGLLYTYDDLVNEAAPLGHLGSFDAQQVSAPNLMIRFGLTDFAELRLTVPDLVWESVRGAGEEVGLGDLSVGAKLATSLTEQVRVGLIPSVQVPVDDGEAGARLVSTAAVDATDDVIIGVNAGFTYAVDTLGEYQLDGLVSLLASFGLTDNISGFVETYALLPEGSPDVFVDTGATFLLAPHTQLDVVLGSQIPDPDVIFAGVGISQLF